VNDGDRTRDARDHNPVLYLLSYVHHEGRERVYSAGLAFHPRARFPDGR
jgi:hypothetical protein